MRNLKRALSLALAAVMLIGMMVIGTSAASLSDFADAGDITHTEAATIINGLEIMKGDDSGFRPNDTITRAEMAIVILKMLYGSNVNASIYGGLDIFDDCDGHWAEPAINMAYTQGIISGVGEGKFDPDAKVTVGEAATMVVKALGISCPGTVWPLNVMSKASELGLFGDMIVLANDPMTRDNIAVLCLEGLQYSPSGSNGYTVEGLSFVFDSFIEAYLACNDDPTKIHAAPAMDTLAKKVFGLTSDGGADELGLSTIVWTATNPKVTITLPANNATLVISKAASGNDLAAHQKSVGLTGYTVAHDATLKVNGSVVAFTNTDDNTAGETARMTQLLGATSSATGVTSANTTVYVYAANKVISSVVVVDEKLAMVTRVTAASGSKAATITVAGKEIEATGYEQGDYVLYNEGRDLEDSSKTVVLNVRKCDSFVGSVTRYTNAGKYTIGGVEYSVNTGLGATVETVLKNNLGKELTFWLDASGKIVAVKAGTAAAAQTNYLYVLGNSSAQTSTDYMNNTSTVIQITAADTAGEIRTYTVSEIDGTPIDSSDPYDANNKLRGNLYSYVEENGTLKLTDVTTASTGAAGTIKANAASITYNTNAKATLNENTNFIFVEFTYGAGDPAPINGYKGLTVRLGNANTGDDFDQADAVVVVENGVAVTVFVQAKYADASTTSGNVVYFSGADKDYYETTSWEDGKSVTVKNYTVYDVTGAKMTMTAEGAKKSAGVYYYNTDNTLGSAIPSETYKTGIINEVNGNTLTISDTGHADGVYEYRNIVNAQVAFIGKDYQLQKGQKIAYVLHSSGSDMVDNIWVIGDTQTVDGSITAAMKAGQTDKFDVVAVHDTLVAGDGVKNVVTVTISKKGTGTFEGVSTIEVTPNANATGSTVYTLADSEKTASTTSVTFTFTLTGTGVKDVLPSLYFEVKAAPCTHSTRTHHDAGTASEVACNAKTNVEYWSCDGCGKNFDAATDGNEIANVNTVDGTKHTATADSSLAYVNQYDSTNTTWQHAVKCVNGEHAADNTSWVNCTATDGSNTKCSVCQHDTAAAAPTEE